jgi:hypothetical protein
MSSRIFRSLHERRSGTIVVANNPIRRFRLVRNRRMGLFG